MTVVRVQNFEGPLDLLLQLIEKRKMQINTISLASITDEYLQQIKEPEKIHMESVAHFVFIASILVLIKSKSLLPLLVYTENDAISSDNLELRLALLQGIREHGENLFTVFNRRVFYPSAQKTRLKNNMFCPGDDITGATVHTTVKEVLHVLPVADDKKKVVRSRDMVSIEDMMKRITKQFQDITASTFFGIVTVRERQEVIVCFLALLEITRIGQLQVSQGGLFEDITIERV